MANKEHIETLKQGVAVWNEWRTHNHEIKPDLSGIDMRHFHLDGMDLNMANLSYTDLVGAGLSNANLMMANLNRADLHYSRLFNSILYGANLRFADLTSASLKNAQLTTVTFEGARLNHADFQEANLSVVNFTDANLRGANLINSDLSLATFDGAVLDDADIRGANFYRAMFGNTSLGNNDLSAIKNLNTIVHNAPSNLGINTLYKLGNKIPGDFLQMCGVPDDLIVYLPSLISGSKPMKLYSCFISYSSKDELFCNLLYRRLRQKGINVWFAPTDIKGGAKIHEQIDHAIHYYDRSLIVISEHSLRSEWVKTEIRKTRKAELKENRRKLFPIRLVNFETIRGWECFDTDTGKDLGVELREYFIPDFSNWEAPDSFEAAFNRLVKDLRETETLSTTTPNNLFSSTHQ